MATGTETTLPRQDKRPKGDLITIAITVITQMTVTRWSLFPPKKEY